MAPDEAGAMRKIPDHRRTEPGFALARFGDGGWWPAVERGLRDGSFAEEVVVALADILRGAGIAASWLTHVPSSRLGPVVGELADRVASELGVPRLDIVRRTEDRPPQREMANAAQQVANVRGAFEIRGKAPPGTGVLLDDRRNSGWTLAMVAGQLRLAGAERVVPLALGTVL
jgi:ATP-dependent DNA helicase RecQ